MTAVELAVLYRRWWHVTFDAALHVTGSEADAEDAAQRVFTRLCRKGRWHDIRHPEAFFRRAGRNEGLVLRLLAPLPPRCHLVCALVILEGLSHREVAERIGVTVSAVEKQIARGRRLLQGSATTREGRLSTFGDGGDNTVVVSLRALVHAQPWRPTWVNAARSTVL